MKKYDLTFPQRNIWMVENFYDSQLINIILGSFVIKKDFDMSLAEQMVNKFVELNEGMRLRIDTENNIPKQYVVPFAPFEADKKDIRGLSEVEIEKFKDEYISKPIDILGGPLFSYLLLDRGNGLGEVFVKVHHIIGDAWTISKMGTAFSDIYEKLLNGEEYTETFPSYIDFIQAEQEYLTCDKYAKDNEFWKEYLQNASSPLGLKDSGIIKDTKAKRHTIVLDEKYQLMLDEYCKLNRVSPYTVFLSALAIYTERVTEKTDFIIGTPVLNRSNFKEKNMSGMFISTMPVRFKIDENETFLEFVKRTGTESLILFRHQKYPYLKISEIYKNISGTNDNMYKLMLSYQNARASVAVQDKYELRWRFSGHIQDELEIHISDLNDTGRLEVHFDYLTSLFEDIEIEYLTKRILALIEDGITNNSKIENIKIMSDEERDKILNEFNDTARPYPKDKTIIELFEEQVKLNPDKVALVFENKAMTYKELNIAANKVALTLVDNGMSYGDTIGIMYSKSIDMVAAILGILKVGATYVPMDKNATRTNKHHIVDTAKLKAIITDDDEISMDNVKMISNISEQTMTEYIRCNSQPDDIVNVMYTSGTTGKPKGVMISNSNIIKLVKSTNYIEFKENDKMLQTGTFTFDASTLELWNGLLNGITLYMVDKELLNPIEFEKIIKLNYITVIFLTTALFNQMITHNAKMFENVRVVMTGGEAISKEHVNKLLRQCPKINIKNLYGPTENTVVTTYYNVIGNERIIPIGKPISNTTCYILDKKYRLMPLYVKGNLYTGGDGVSKGYISNEDLTKKRFLENKFETGRIYDTGDIVYVNAQGNIIFCGRADSEIKIKGVRVDIEEIKNKVNQFGNIINNEIVAMTDVRKNKFLVLFFVSNKSENIDALKIYLKSFLPSQINISKIMQLEQLPLTLNGKIDKEILKEKIDIMQMEAECEELHKYSGVSLKIYNIFKEVLEITNIKPDDDFFEIGGDSLSGIEVVTKAIENDVSITYKDLFKYKTIRNLSNMVEKSIVQENNNNISDYNYEKIERLLMNQDNQPILNACKDVILTGATGYLGAHIISEYVNRYNGKIYCLVRSLNSEEPAQRLRKRLNYYFGNKYDELIGSRIVVIGYNKEITSIDNLPTENVSHLINSLALVKHYGNYKEFYDVNVENVELLSKICLENNIELVQISTLSVSGDIVETAQAVNDKSRNKKIYNENTLYNGQELDNVYAYTKFLAERKVLEKIIDCGMKAKILRMGNLSDRFDDGKFQINDKENAFSTRLRSLIKMGIIPEETEEQSLDFTPIDFAAKAVVTLLEANENQIVYHLFNNNKVRIKDIVQELIKKDISIRFGNDTEVRQAIYNNIEENDADELKGILVDTTSEDELRYVTGIDVINEISNNILKRYGFYWPKIDNAYLSRFIDRILNNKEEK